MATNLLKFHLQTSKITKIPCPNLISTKISFPFLLILPHRHFRNRHFHVAFYPPTTHEMRIPFFLRSSLSSSSPPTSKEEAVLQAKTCLSTTLEKPLNSLKFSGRFKKATQPRFRLEIPVVDESPSSLSQLAYEVFADLSIRRKGSPVKTLIIWPSPSLAEAAIKAFESRSSSSNQIEQIHISLVDGVDARILNSADVTVFFAPESSQLQTIKTITDSLYPKPVVIFNPRWVFEEEGSFGEFCGFVGSFEVIYSFMGLEVQGILNKRKGVIFKCVRNGVLSGETWNVLVEEEGGALKPISKFKARPSISEVENVLYNLMAMNSPIAKSAKFLRDLVSNVTGKK